MTRNVAEATGDAEDISPTQVRYLEIIGACIRVNGYPPSTREIADLLGGRSTNAISEVLRRMERKGLLLRGPVGTARTLRLTRHGWSVLGVFAPRSPSEGA